MDQRIAASELAEYAYCPRAWWYRRSPPPEGPSPAGERRARVGERYHARTLSAERRRDAWAGPIAAVAGAALLAAIVLLAWAAGAG